MNYICLHVFGESGIKKQTCINETFSCLIQQHEVKFNFSKIICKQGSNILAQNRSKNYNFIA